jgi:hypothetical protein
MAALNYRVVIFEKSGDGKVCPVQTCKLSEVDLIIKRQEEKHNLQKSFDFVFYDPLKNTIKIGVVQSMEDFLSTLF